MVRTTKKERNRVARRFQNLFEALYDIELFYDYNDRREDSSDKVRVFDVNQVTSDKKLAHFGDISKGIGIQGHKLGIHYERWRKLMEEEKLIVLIHEATHFRHRNHKPAFWQTAVANYKKIKQNPQAIPSFDVEWDITDNFMIADGYKYGGVDSRITTPTENASKIADKLNLDFQEDFGFFRHTDMMNLPDERVYIKNIIDFKRYSRKELRDMVKPMIEEPLNRVVPETTLTLKETPEGYVAVEGDWMVDFNRFGTSRSVYADIEN